METKQCKKGASCVNSLKGELPLSAFGKHSNCKDGHVGTCRECTAAYSRKYRADNIDEIRRKDKLRFKDPVRRKNVMMRAKAYKKTNPEKALAHRTLNNAIRDQKVKKPTTCQDCGTGGMIHAHHHDYSKPLDVMFLCPVCHSVEHQRMREAA